MGKSNKVYIILILSMLAWGSLYPVSKLLMSQINPFFLAFLRCFSAVIVLTPFFIIEIRKNRNVLNVKYLITFAAAGILGVTIFAIFLFYGISLSTASNGSIITNTQPVFAAILAPLLIGESIALSQITGIFIGLGGLFLVVTGGDVSVLTSGSSMLTGNLLLIGAAVSMSLYSIILKSSIKKYGGLLPTWISMIIGTFLLYLCGIFTRNITGRMFLSIGGIDWALILFLGVISTAVPYLLFNTSLKYIEVVKATAFKFLIPVSGVSLSVFILGERPAAATYAGIAIVIFSVFLIQRRPTPATVK